MRIIALLDVLGGEFHFADRVFGAVSGERNDFKFVGTGCDNIEVVEINRVAGVGDNGAHITGEKILSVADAEHQRASPSRANDEVGNVGVNQRNAIGPDYLPKRRPHGRQEPRFSFRHFCGAGARVGVKFADEVRQHFGIRFGAKIGVAVAHQLVFQRLVIFDHTVMHQRQLAARVEVRMGILIRHFAMRGPARVAHPK